MPTIFWNNWAYSGAGCPSLAQTIYLDRHNAVTSAVHWNLCGLYGFEQLSQWWCHHPEPVLDSGNYKLLYDFDIYTDCGITARRPDLGMMDKITWFTGVIDVACVMDHHVIVKHKEKTEKYLDLAIVLQVLLNTKSWDISTGLQYSKSSAWKICYKFWAPTMDWSWCSSVTEDSTA